MLNRDLCGGGEAGGGMEGVMTSEKIGLTPDRYLNEAEILSIKRLKAKKVPYEEIADRIGIPVDRIKAICKSRRN